MYIYNALYTDLRCNYLVTRVKKGSVGLHSVICFHKWNEQYLPLYGDGRSDGGGSSAARNFCL